MNYTVLHWVKIIYLELGCDWVKDLEEIEE